MPQAHSWATWCLPVQPLSETVAVFNMPFEARERDLEDLAHRFGHIVNVEISVDRRVSSQRPQSPPPPRRRLAEHAHVGHPLNHRRDDPVASALCPSTPWKWPSGPRTSWIPQ